MTKFISAAPLRQGGWMGVLPAQLLEEAGKWLAVGGGREEPIPLFLKKYAYYKFPVAFDTGH